MLFLANCVSHITFPHFVRFIVYAVTSMVYLEAFLFRRCAVLWQNRDLPSVRLTDILLFDLLLISASIWGQLSHSSPISLSSS